MTPISYAEDADTLVPLLSLAEPSEQEAQRIRGLVTSLKNWDTLWQVAEHNATSPLLFHNLQTLGCVSSIPPYLRQQFEARALKVQTANQARLSVAREFFARFAEKKIPVVLLKGVLFAETLYKNPNYKKMNDVDILIRKEDLNAVYDIYASMNMFCAAELVGGEPRKQEKFSHHAPPFFSRDLTCMVGTHWGLITPLSPYRLDYDAIWSRVVDIDFYGLPAKSMAAEDNLHHLCVHLPYYKCGVRELADIYNLIRHADAGFDWSLFHQEVDKAGTQDLAYHALSLAHRLHPLASVERALFVLGPSVSWYCRHDTARKTASLSRLLRARSVHLSRIEKAFTDLRNTEKPTEKWSAYGQMLSGLLWPPDADVVRMCSLEGKARGPQWMGARLVSPWRIYRVFKRDLGSALFVAILAKCLADCVGTSVRSLWPSDSPAPNLDDYARKLGVAPEALHALKEALE